MSNIPARTFICPEPGSFYQLPEPEAGLTYEWKDEKGALVGSRFINKEGTYFARISDFIGCESSDELNLVHYEAPQPEILAHDVCPGESLELTTSLNYASYEWDDASTGASKLAYGDGSSHTVKIVDDNGCSGVSEPVVVNTRIAPAYVLDQDTAICQNETVVLDAYNGYQTYLWTKDGVPYSDQRRISVSEAGNYEVSVYDGCFTLKNSSKVEINPLPEFSVVDT